MRTTIISAFPGTGKSFYHTEHPDITLDSDSINYSWLYRENGTKVRHPNFPQNYINHIKENIGKYKYIFVSSHKEVREALLDNCLFFHLVYPRVSDKALYMKRYEDRGSNPAFIKLIGDNWVEWLKEVGHCASYEEGVGEEALEYGETITNVIDWLENPEIDNNY